MAKLKAGKKLKSGIKIRPKRKRLRNRRKYDPGYTRIC